jgi:glyoxylase-like metal-dependent hydrolase (beta-lactamase superfamily II)
LHLPGHCNDASCVYFPAEKVLVAGDTVLRWETEEEIVIPYFYWGNSDDLVETYHKLLGMEIEKVIPGHGRVCGLERVEEQLFYVSRLKELFEDIFHNRPSDIFREARQFFVKKLTLERVFEKEFRRRNWVEKAHRLNIERLMIERGLTPEEAGISDW